MVHVLLSEPSWQWMCHCPFHFCPGTETDVYFNLFTINLLFLRRLAIRFKQLIQPEVMWLKCGSYLTFLLCQIQLIKCNRNATVDSDIALLSHLTQSQYCSVCGSVGNILQYVQVTLGWEWPIFFFFFCGTKFMHALFIDIMYLDTAEIRIDIALLSDNATRLVEHAGKM